MLFGVDSVLIVFVMVGVSFLFCLFGVFLVGYFGDKFGCKVVFMWMLILMGVVIVLIGLLFIYEIIGFMVLILLVLFCII